MTATAGDAAVQRLMNEAVPEGTLDLSIGEPDQALPRALRDAAIASLDSGDTGYTPKLGLADLRAAVADDAGPGVSSADVAITVGGSEAVAVAIAATCAAGDTLVVPDPAWPNYRVLATSLGIRVATYRQGADRESFLDLNQIEEHLRAGARMVVVNSPSNPMGSLASQADLDALVELVARHGAWLLSDEAYRDIVFDAGRAPSPTSSPGGREVTLQCLTFSKTYSMTGMRVGALVHPAALRLAVAAVHGTLVGCAPHMAQRMALTALAELPHRGHELSLAYGERFGLALDALGDWMNTRGVAGHGGYYAWVEAGEGGYSASALTEAIGERGVRVSSGNVYSVAETHAVRLALTAPASELARAFEVIAEVLRMSDAHHS